MSVLSFTRPASPPTCDRADRFDTWSEADKFLRSLRRTHRIRTLTGPKHARIAIYRCALCRTFHVGSPRTHRVGA